MFPQTTLDYALLRIADAGRRAELTALHRGAKVARARVECRPPAAPRPAACCA